ncbi:MAG: UDP-N-acetylmuramoyl-L-alanyl-D-glutamate--2,6-diaminopimelate ligase [Puniceicoccales bacterium]|jgi:UDP-N-acetylmuramoyl-L-alanyl-D-glutamate--2,6-diaminopimelate ligase|nr:UDP-N-acetylmuramoyl-L-alanyl-D-glutamate--2,6-diaminopimelate ligase [Puniceicoccales bacterium]
MFNTYPLSSVYVTHPIISFPLLKFMSQPVDLKTLLKDIEVIKIIGPKGNPQIKSLAIHSQMAQLESLFFAIPGIQYPGSDFIEEASRRGAVACICEQLIPHVGYILQIQVQDVRQALSQISNKFYNRPDTQLQLIGITGTSGKTTTSWLLKHLLTAHFKEGTGLLGTLHYDLGKRILPALRTTPDALSIAAYLREMVQSQLKHAVLEVSSHGIEQKRVAALQFDTAIFTNLSTEHLDYHNTMDNYFRVKKSLFWQKGLKHAVINQDDPYGQTLLKDLPHSLNIITFGTRTSATLRAKNVRIHSQGTQFDLVCPQGQWTVKTPLLGTFNVYNCLAALAVCYAQGYNLTQSIEALKTFPTIPGRLEKILSVQNDGIDAFVDYAHKPQALKNVLQTLRPLTQRKIHLVFGCGGNRDRTKRPLMARVAETYADVNWITSDNPRTEPQSQIFDDIRTGLLYPDKVTFMEDRAEAIRKAFANCESGDCLLIVGKGHERYQEINHQFFPFDDRTILVACCSSKNGKLQAV